MQWLIKSLRILILFTIVINSVYSQGIISNINEILPAPTASGITKYAEIPVNYYSGKPNISLPIYELSDRDISVPISLSYHAEAIKVDDVASWVGLNWSLIAGGTITRTTIGKPDEGPNGFLSILENDSRPIYGIHTDDPSFALDPEDGEDKGLLELIYSGTWDTRPDEFRYNFMGYSGSFMYNNDGVIVTIPKKNFLFDIQTETNASGITGIKITDDKGFEYQFGGGEATEITSVTTSESAGASSAWHLTSVTSPAGGVITFTYQPNVISYQVRETEYYETPQANCQANVNSAPQQYQITEYNLASITSSSIRVNFIPDIAPRNDLYGGVRLKDIEVIDLKSSELLESYELIHDYYNEEDDEELNLYSLTPRRLRFKMLKKKSLDDDFCKDQVHLVEYNADNILRRNSMDQDHWGFQNSVNYYASGNDTMIPQAGANRSPNSSGFKGLISKLIYPTGGWSEFEFEGYTHIEPTEIEYSRTVGLNQSFEVNCDLQVGASVRVEFSGTEAPVFLIDFEHNTDPSKNFSTSFNLTPQFNHYQFCHEPGNGSLPECENVVEGEISFQTTISFPYDGEGIYIGRLNESSTSNVSGLYFTMYYDWCTIEQREVYYVGGARISDIMYYSKEGDLAKKTEFSYSNINVLNPVYEEDYRIPHYSYFPVEETQPCVVEVFSSESGKTGGLNAGHETVIVRDVVEGAYNGKTVYTYMLTENRGGGSGNPRQQRITKPYLQGVLLQKDIIDRSNTIIETKKYKYSLDTDMDRVWGFALGRKADYAFVDNSSGGGGGEVSVIYFYEWFQNPYTYDVEWLRLDSVINHKELSGNILEKVTVNAYNDKNLLSKETTFASDGTLIETDLEYSFDFNGTAFYELIDRNYITTPIHKQVRKNGKVIEDTYNQFSTSDLVLPQSIHTLNSQIPVEPMAVSSSANVDNDGSISFGNLHRLQVAFEEYSPEGHLETFRSDNQIQTRVVDAFGNPSALFHNAKNNEVYFASFENDNQSVLSTYNPLQAVDDGFDDSNGYSGDILFQPEFVDSNKSFIVGFMAKGGGNVSVNGVSLTTSANWEYYAISVEVEFSDISIDISEAVIDNVIIYPSHARFLGAQVSKVGVGAITSIDPNGKTSSYKYDGFNRLTHVLDHDGHVLKHNEYGFLDKAAKADFEFNSIGDGFFLNEEIRFDATMSSDPEGRGLLYNWSFGGTDPVEIHQFTTPGNIEVSLTVDNQCAEPVTITKSFDILNRDPVADFTISAPNGFYIDQNISFDANSSYDPDNNPLAYNWSFGGTQPSLSKVYGNIGSYSVTLTITDDFGATDNITKTFEIENRDPVALFSMTDLNDNNISSIREGWLIKLDDAGSYDPEGQNIQYSWVIQGGSYGGGTIIGSGPSSNHSINDPGTYNVILEVEDEYGATGRQTKSLTVTTAPDVVFNGRVVDSNGYPVPNIQVSASSGGAGTTNSDGYYTIETQNRSEITVTPNHSTYTFNPAMRLFSDPEGNTSVSNFISSGGGVAPPNPCDSNPVIVNPSSKTYSGTPASSTFNVSSSGSFSVSDNRSWITISNKTSSSFKVNVTQNGSSVRTGTVTVTQNGCSRSISITQQAYQVDPCPPGCTWNGSYCESSEGIPCNN